MNVKPGDLAIIKADGRPLYDGRIVEVLYATPYESHQLPDGYVAVGSKRPEWIVKFLGGPITAPISTKGARSTRLTWYGSVPDYALKLLPGIPDEEETSSNLSSPATQTEDNR